jgi:hypothetical protein
MTTRHLEWRTAVTENKKQIGVIDLTPAWSAILPILLEAARTPDNKGYEAAMSELKRMAEIADLYVASQKEVLP